MNRFLIWEVDLNYSFKRYSFTTYFASDAVLSVGNIDVKKTESSPKEAYVLAGETGNGENKKRYNLMSGNNKCHKEIKQSVGIGVSPVVWG